MNNIIMLVHVDLFSEVLKKDSCSYPVAMFHETEKAFFTKNKKFPPLLKISTIV